jgi:cobalt/nickel transport system permease protein
VSHLHVPDGVLPVALWAPGLALALILLVLSARSLRRATAQHMAYRGALGALVLAAMAVQIPFGPLEYHLTLVGPVGVLLGPAAGYQVVFVASAMLAFVGHGGFTVIGLNGLVLGAGVALARPVYEWLARSRRPPAAMAAATAAGQAVSGALWLTIVVIALGARAGVEHPGGPPGRLGLLLGLAAPMWLIGVVVATVVAVGIARFLWRVRPDLLPRAGAGERDAAGGAA